jgi:alpha-L-rhamnosidase
MKRLPFLSACMLVSLSTFAQLQVNNLTTEHLENPIGIDVINPRFSWQLNSDRRDVMQVAYEIRMGSSTDLTKSKNITWNTGKVISGQSLYIPYKGPQVSSGARYYWQVRVWDNHQQASNWSEPSYFEMALLHPADWKAKWIEPGYVEDSLLRPSPYLRKTFASNKKIRSARLYITSHGLYEAFINGHKVGDAYLTPGWTSYNNRLQYQVYDVTPLINQGNNAIGAVLGNGWYRGNLAWEKGKDNYGTTVGVLAQLQINYIDGSSGIITSDESWKSNTGSIRYSEIYHGEIQDARKDNTGWSTASFNDKEWTPVKVNDQSKDLLVATYNEPVRQHEIFKPVKIFTTPKGEKVIDFGQNLVGWVELNVKGHRGDSIKIYHAEVLTREGNFYTENLRGAKERDIYVLNGNGKETFHPHFTFQGFRYIRIVGFPGEIKPENFTAYALYSDMKPTGRFTSSNALINQLQHNIQWGQRGNFLDVPTDCPQRDERLGWTGDAQAFSRTATFNMDVKNFFSKWLKDVALDQLPSGSVPFVVPNVLGANSAGSTGWADVATIIPWNMYLAYGDTAILQQQYESMKRWVNFMQTNSTNDLWNKGFHFGDWLFYRPADDNDGRSAVTDKYLIAQCFYAWSTQLLVNAAGVLGKTADVKQYSDHLDKIKEAFLKEYVTPGGRLVSATQTAYVLALNFDMLPEQLREQAAKRLVENIESYNNHLTTGFLGTPYLCHVLSRFGYTDVAYKLLLQESYPSWLYPVKMGATTIWERWDGQKPDGSFQNPGMNSFNHYAYGAIGDWMYRVIAGIDTYQDAPGYKKIKIQPHMGTGINEVSADYQTSYGVIGSHWKNDSNLFHLDVQIPANTRAILYIPASDVSLVLENNKPINMATGLNVIGKEQNYIVIEAGSGSYSFTAKKD